MEDNRIGNYNDLCGLIRLTDKITDLLGIQDHYNAMKLNLQFSARFGKLISRESALTPNEKAALAQIAGEYMNAQENGDYMGMADVCSQRLRPLCTDILSDMRQNGLWQELKDYYGVNHAACDADTRKMLDLMHAEDDSDIPDRYRLEETQVGSFALKILSEEAGGRQGGPSDPKARVFTLDSTDNPYRQAEMFVDAHFEKGSAICVMFGLGMGYNAAALYKREDIVSAEIYEHDAYVIKAAMHFTDLSEVLSSGKVKIIYDPRLEHFAARLGRLGGAALIMHYPSLKNIKDLRLREKTEDFFMHYSSVRSQERALSGNFIMNTSVQGDGIPSADSLYGEFCGKNVIFIAGGPSLDDNIEALSEMSRSYVITRYTCEGAESIDFDEVYGREKYIVVCAGTVLKRLISEGVVPDHVVMTDAQPNMTAQIRGIDTSKLSLIYLSTVYHKVPEMWNGSKHIAYQKGFAPAEKTAAEKGAMLFETGGSVATFALDLCLRMGCARIVCLGLDLAYTDGLRHAGDKSRADTGGCRTADAVGGGKVATASNLDNYRIWIEQRLKRRSDEEKHTRIINISRGAVIHGMENMRPEDIRPEDIRP